MLNFCLRRVGVCKTNIQCLFNVECVIINLFLKNVKFMCISIFLLQTQTETKQNKAKSIFIDKISSSKCDCTNNFLCRAWLQ